MAVCSTSVSNGLTGVKYIYSIYSVCSSVVEYVAVEAPEGRTSHNNVWFAANEWHQTMCLMYLIPFHFAPAITRGLSYPIKMPPTSCGM